MSKLISLAVASCQLPVISCQQMVVGRQDEQKQTNNQAQTCSRSFDREENWQLTTENWQLLTPLLPARASERWNARCLRLCRAPRPAQSRLG